MKILILGGTGAMGVPLVEILSSNHPDWLIHVTSRKDIDSPFPNVAYIKGNARDPEFLESVVGAGRYDVIVDFMNYNLDEYEERIPLLLSSTDHYLWTSSARVYANSEVALTEKSPRLLETSDDKDFLSTNRYALRKARQENLLKLSNRSNFTVIRPYITYNEERLQLGILEKEQWLFRLLRKRPLVVSSEMLNHVTTLSYGYDVAMAIASVIEKGLPEGDIIQIAGRDTIKWRDLLYLYVDIIKSCTNFNPEVYASNDLNSIEMLYEGGYNTIYDRNYDRVFDSGKIEELIGHKVCPTKIKEGISKCLRQFLQHDRRFLRIDPIYEAYQDILTNQQSIEDDFDSHKDWCQYLEYRNKSAFETFGCEPVQTRII